MSQSRDISTYRADGWCESRIARRMPQHRFSFLSGISSSITDQLRLKSIEKEYIGRRLDALRAPPNLRGCDSAHFSCTPNAWLDRLVQCANAPLITVLACDTCRPFSYLRFEYSLPVICRLPRQVVSSFDTIRIYSFPPQIPIVLTSTASLLCSRQVFRTVAPPSSPNNYLVSPIDLWLRNTSSFANPSQSRNDMDRVLQEYLGVMYVKLPGFYEASFGGVAGLERASEMFFDN